MSETPELDGSPVRDEDAFDVAAVHAWLRAQVDDVPVGVPERSEAVEQDTPRR